MSNAAVMMNVVLRLRSALLREGNRHCAASSCFERGRTLSVGRVTVEN